jgi:hypothetical protein
LGFLGLVLNGGPDRVFARGLSRHFEIEMKCFWLRLCFE